MSEKPRGALLHRDFPVDFYDRAMAEPGRKWQHLVPLYDTVRMHINTADRVLEIGCGIGRLVNRIARRGRHVWACDFAPSAIKRTRAILRESGKERLATVIECDLRKPWPAEIPDDLDVVIAVEVLEHIGKDIKVVERALDRAPRLLASVPNGHAIPSKDHVREYDEHVIRERFGTFGEIYFIRYRDYGQRILFEIRR